MLTDKEMTGEIKIPRHVAIIMDGNGRWAEKRGLSRVKGHREGAAAVRRAIEAAAKLGVHSLTLFAFSSENWKRPQAEVAALMELFSLSLKKETPVLHRNNIKAKVIGDVSRFNPGLQKAIKALEETTAGNSGLELNIAANYGGRWDIVEACRKIQNQISCGQVTQNDLNEEYFNKQLSLPQDIDLLIRTGGEMRISNFLLWQCAYSELYVTDVLWPDFGEEELKRAFLFFSGRERRFGMTSAQIRGK